MNDDFDLVNSVPEDGHEQEIEIENEKQEIQSSEFDISENESSTQNQVVEAEAHWSLGQEHSSDIYEQIANLLRHAVAVEISQIYESLVRDLKSDRGY